MTFVDILYSHHSSLAYGNSTFYPLKKSEGNCGFRKGFKVPLRHIGSKPMGLYRESWVTALRQHGGKRSNFITLFHKEGLIFWKLRGAKHPGKGVTEIGEYRNRRLESVVEPRRKRRVKPEDLNPPASQRQKDCVCASLRTLKCNPWLVGKWRSL